MSVSAVNNQPNTELTQKANELVNMVFYGRLLQECRDAHGDNMLDNGPGSQTFWKMLDSELVKRMSQGRPSSLAQSLIDHLGRQGGGRDMLSIRRCDSSFKQEEMPWLTR